MENTELTENVELDFMSDDQKVSNHLREAKRDQEIEDLEEKLGIDGVKPSSKKQFKAHSCMGTTAYNAFTKPTIRVIENEQFEQIVE